MKCYDTCTREYIHLIVGHSDTDNRFCYLDDYRNKFEKTKVKYLYLFKCDEFSVTNKEALQYLIDHGLVLIPLVGPNKNIDDYFPQSVKSELLTKIYHKLLFNIWEHLRLCNQQNRLEEAVYVDIQIKELGDRLSRVCDQLVDSRGNRMLVKINNEDIHKIILRHQEKLSSGQS